MKKISIQGIFIIISFFSVWLLLSQIEWITILDIESNSEKTEQKIGELLLENIQRGEVIIDNDSVVKSVDSVLSKICKSNNINRDDITFHIIEKDVVNAFALPDGNLIVYSGLILETDNPAEFSGVLAHEIAHLELDHVMKKLVKEVGLSVLISISTGGSESVILQETAKILSSTAFDRSLEKDADVKAVEYLINSNIDPEPFANFLYKLAGNDHELDEYLSWVKTHPNLKDRAEYIIEYKEGKSITPEPILSQETWSDLKTILNPEP